MKVHVISARGKLVGTFIPQQLQPSDPKTPICTPIAGGGQKLHELEIADAESYYEERRTADLHKIVKKKLKLK
ncbi:MAG TPA: hypothetical protein VE054_03820 [Blattabacteriaceae bacterium]|jgi:hypothetical protein|nr:hypothetical protein [Blattabacteriaceae bacterium]